jgi:hypothetical protein
MHLPQRKGGNLNARFVSPRLMESATSPGEHEGPAIMKDVEKNLE